MTIRGRSALLLTAWLAWTAWVVGHAFTMPADRVVLFDGAVAGAAHWREAAARAAWALAGAAWVLAAAFGAGGLLLARVRTLFDTPLEGVLFQLATGCVGLSAGLLLLAWMGLYRPIPIKALLAPLVLALLIRGAASRRRPSAEPIRPATAGRRGDRVWLACAAVAIGFALVAALAPEIEYDALWYHLWLPAKWLAAGRPVDIVEEYISLYPLSWELLYGAAMTVGGPIAAKLLHFTCLPLAGGAAFMTTRRLFPRASPALAAALAVVAPTVIWEATTAYVDLALAVYVTLVVYAVWRYHESADRRWLVVGAVLMGMALGIKHLALVALAIVTAGLVGREWRRPRRALLPAALFALIALLIASPWYVRAYRASGDPVFPELFGLFGASPPARWSAGADQALGRFKAHFGRSRTAAHLAVLPWDVTVHGARYGGSLGPLFLLLVPAAFVSKRSTALRTTGLGCAAYAAVWASSAGSFQMRFLVPVVPLLAAMSAEGARTIADAARSIWPSAALVPNSVVLTLLLANLPCFTAWHEVDRQGWSDWLTHVVRGLPIAVVAGAESEHAYLARLVPSFRAWGFIDAHLPPGSRVLTFSGGDHLYSARPRIWSDAVAARDLTWSSPAGSEARVLGAARRLAVTHVLFDRRQLEAGGLAGLAIADDRMRRCCLTRVYEDDRFVLCRIADAGGRSASAVLSRR